MPCTTILIGKNATYDGSTIVARNEDSPSGEFCAKRLEVMKPEDQPRLYKSLYFFCKRGSRTSGNASGNLWNL